MDKQIAVVIPVHNSFLSSSERISLLQCRRVLSNYSVFLVYPFGADINNYLSLYPALQPQPVPADWLSTIEAYNKMKKSISFYQLFDKFDFMLTYELDAYIFSDNWEKANCFHYDYIGAPMFEGHLQANANSKIIGGGNSGFSMRNIKSCIRILKKVAKLKKYYRLFYKAKRLVRFTLLFRLFDKSWNVRGSNYYFLSFISDKHINEDMFWAFVVPKVIKNFSIASIPDSIKFSFEILPSVLFSMNEFTLPLGCHAWGKYEPGFWKPFVKS